MASTLLSGLLPLFGGSGGILNKIGSFAGGVLSDVGAGRIHSFSDFGKSLASNAADSILERRKGKRRATAELPTYAFKGIAGAKKRQRKRDGTFVKKDSTQVHGRPAIPDEMPSASVDGKYIKSNPKEINASTLTEPVSTRKKSRRKKKRSKEEARKKKLKFKAPSDTISKK